MAKQAAKVWIASIMVGMGFILLPMLTR